MTGIRWSDNICNVGHTCVHGFFTANDLDLLLDLCPSATVTPTFYSEKLPAGGYAKHELNRVRLALQAEHAYPPGPVARGFYITFLEAEGGTLLEYLKSLFIMKRGEPCL